jgi:HD-GYP domain-containing protein (c-di-GMP phosphodiesterase class II)
MASLSPQLLESGHGFRSWSPDSLRIKQLEEELRAQRSALICAFNQLLDLKDLGTGIHSTRLAEWGMRVAQELNLSDGDLHDIEIAALLHDIGKIGIPDSILNKPGRLTDEEYALMKKHPEYGWAVLRLFPGFEQVSLFILHHHENFDGSGYPAGLAAQEIPIGSRIVSVIDAFDAMVSCRPYRQGLAVEEAIRRLEKDSGTQFDAAVVRSFIGIASQEMDRVFAAVGTPSASQS